MYEFREKVELFSGSHGSHFVCIPRKFTDQLKHLKMMNGQIPINALVGPMTWQTNLMPVGNQRYFLALTEKIRDLEKIKINDYITIKFWPKYV